MDRQRDDRIAGIADGKPKSLDPRVVHAWRIGLAVVGAILCGAGLIAVIGISLAQELPRWGRWLLLAGWPIGALLVLAWVWFWPAVSYRHRSYRVLPDGMEIRAGVIWRVVIHVPKSRVQHTDVSRGPLERWLGLAKLVIYTAGTEHASIEVAGLAEADALAIRDHLIPGGTDDAV